MSKVKFKLNLPGLNELMRSSEMQAILTEQGNNVLSRAQAMSQIEDSEYLLVTKPISFVAIARVSAVNHAARQDNYDNNTLIKALGGGGR